MSLEFRSPAWRVPGRIPGRPYRIERLPAPIRLQNFRHFGQSRVKSKIPGRSFIWDFWDPYKINIGQQNCWWMPPLYLPNSKSSKFQLNWLRLFFPAFWWNLAMRPGARCADRRSGYVHLGTRLGSDPCFGTLRIGLTQPQPPGPDP